MVLHDIRTFISVAPWFDKSQEDTDLNKFKEESVSFQCPAKGFPLNFTAVDGGFSKWTPFSSCSVTCGGSGVKVRTRTCTNPPRQWKGKDCVGARQESMACNEGPCKWYINPWSLNKGGKTIIWKAACSQRARLVEIRWRGYSWKIRVGTRGVLPGIVNLLDKNKK